MNSLLVRDYHPQDKTTLLEIFRCLVPTYFSSEEISDYDYYLTNVLDRYFVIEIKGKVVGACGINRNYAKASGAISWIFVHPEAQKKNAARMLVQHCLDILKKDTEIVQIFVRTSQYGEVFFQKQGFYLHEIKKDYWALGIDLYYMIYQGTVK